MKIYMVLFVTCLYITTTPCYPQGQDVTPGLPSYTQLNADQIKYLQYRGFGETQKTLFPTAAYEAVEEYGEQDNAPESSQDRQPTYAYPTATPKTTYYPTITDKTYALQQQYRRAGEKLQAAYEAVEEYDEQDNAPEQSQDRQPTYAYPTATPKTTYYPTITAKSYALPRVDSRQQLQQQQQQQYRRAGEKIQQPNNKLEEEDEKEEEDEPDRLTLLLPQSKFLCAGKKTGYYADTELGCEVFHYCQGNARHSWICPEGFTFHQIQLICMPPSGDNICEKSSDYFFVNDYLYKPVNLEEYQHSPNTSLRYSDRYFPDSYRPKYDEEEDDRPHRHSVRVTAEPRYQQIPVQSTTFRPQSQLDQVFRSPEEINISLQQRRPQFSTAKYIDVYERE